MRSTVTAIGGALLQPSLRTGGISRPSGGAFSRRISGGGITQVSTMNSGSGAAMGVNAWKSASWVEPKGGMFFWLELPEEINTEKLLQFAIQEGVAFVPGKGFYVNNQKSNTLRLNFSHSNSDRINSGMERLNTAYERYINETN